METHQKQESEREKREKREKREEREKREKRVSAGGHLFQSFDLEQKKKSVSQISSPLFFILPSNKFLPFCPNIE